MTISENEAGTSDSTMEELQGVREWWESHVCGSQNATAEKFSKEYFTEIEHHRYAQEPFIQQFAEFERYKGKSVLEVGIGAATDFTQWVRAGARAHGVDLTPAAILHAQRRLAVEGLKAVDLRVANAEALEYADEEFDLVYSWGVLHHSASIEKAMSEVVRVLRRGGRGKIMLYNRRSLTAAYIWLKWGLLRGRPLRSISQCLASFVESPNTKAVTRDEVRSMLSRLSLRVDRIESVLTYQDRLDGYPSIKWLGHALTKVVDPKRHGWFLLIEFTKG